MERLFNVSKAKYLFFLFLLFIPIGEAIIIHPNVKISYGCLDSGCNVTFDFQNPLSFFNIQVYHSRIRYNYRDICLVPPKYIYVFNYSDVWNYECCYPDWVANYSNCNITDQNVLTYYDLNHCGSNETLPLNNGTTQVCNYCSESISQLFTDCNENSTKIGYYVDSNKGICCDITNLPSDCDILIPPYSVNITQNCNATKVFMGELNCQHDPNMEAGDKQNCIGLIPEQYRNEEYKCISTVQEKNSKETVQVNPQISNYPILEARTYFEPAYSQVNFYYTSKNLDPEKDYVVKIECASPERTLYSEYTIQRQYASFDWVFFRAEWLKENVGYLIGGAVAFILVVGTLVFLFKKSF